jgi:redox-sensitive bicupin YhaK (pirin superfamily)
MLKLRKSHDRGYFDHGWLKTHHTFSFAGYFDRYHMAFRNLRVINEDIVRGGHGFDTHPHRDMEILTYIVSGALEHKDSMGNGAVIRPGEVQYMSAGTGVLHSESNPGQEPCHLLQIWILPRSTGEPPAYDQRKFDVGPMTRLAAPDDDPHRGNAIPIRADTSLYAGKVPPGTSQAISLRNGFGWIQVVRGQIEVNAPGRPVSMSAGDGLAISDEVSVTVKVTGSEPAEVLLFDLA